MSERNTLFSHIAFGLVTYVPVIVIFSYIFFDAVAAPDIPSPFAHALSVSLSLTTYLLIYGIFGALFALPALVIATFGIRRGTYRWLNIVSALLAAIILLWNIFSLATGGAWFA